jgi:hypothetical protein
MKRIALIIGWLFLAAPCWGVSAYVQSTHCTVCSSLAFGSNVTAGNNIYVVVFDGAGSGTTISATDGQSNTYTLNKTANLATDLDTVGVLCAPIASSGALTVTPHSNGGTLTGGIIIYEVSGGTCTTDGSNSQNVVAGPPTSCDSQSITTAFANDVLVGLCGTAHTNETFTLGTGWSHLEQVGTQAGNDNNLGGEIIVGSNSAGSFDAQMSYTNGAEYAAIIVAYKSSGGGGGASCTPTLMLLGVGRC